MQKNLYYRTVFQRRNVIGEALLAFFLRFASWPRILLEVFIRKNFGERYFSLPTTIILTIVLAFIPYVLGLSRTAFNRYYAYERYSQWDFIIVNMSWYLFLAAFQLVAVIRWSEIKLLPSVFDFARFSLSAGEIHPRFLALQLGRKPISIRVIEILLEPLLFFLIGGSLLLLGQLLGLLLILCSIFYSFSYAAAYQQGDHFVMDKIDEMICSEELVSSFVEGRDPSQTRGVNYYGRKPADPEIRRKVAETFLDEEEEVTVK